MSIAESIVREIERAIEAAEFPSGMSVHDGKAKVDSSHLRRLLAELAALRAELEQAKQVIASWEYSAKYDAIHVAALRAERDALRAEVELWKERAYQLSHA